MQSDQKIMKISIDFEKVLKMYDRLFCQIGHGSSTDKMVTILNTTTKNPKKAVAVTRGP